MPTLRTDIIDVYVFRRGARVEFLQLLRAREPLKGTWQPVMGHVEAGETGAACALREVREEVGLGSAAMVGAWALQGVHPFFVAAVDAVVLSARFAVEVGAGWEPVLNAEHTAWRWVEGEGAWMWPGQRAAVREVMEVVVAGGAGVEHLRLG